MRRATRSDPPVGGQGSIQQSSQTLSSSPSASGSATGEASGSDTSTEQDQPATFVMMTSLPELKGGNRALRKKITYPDQAN